MKPNAGFGDPFLNWEGAAQSFDTESNFDKTLTLTITNAGTADQLVILCPSRKPSDANRVIRDGVIPYASGQTTLSSAIDKNTIAEFLEEIKFEPTWMLNVKIVSNNSLVGSKNFSYTKKDVFKPTPETRAISFTKFTSEFATNDKMFTIKERLLWSIKRELAMVVPKAMTSGEDSIPTEVNLIMSFGVGLSLDSAAEKKYLNAL